MRRRVWYVLGRREGDHETEILDEFNTKDEARAMAAEYRVAFGRGWVIFIRSSAKREAV